MDTRSAQTAAILTHTRVLNLLSGAPLAIVLPGASAECILNVHNELIAREFRFSTINRFLELQDCLLPRDSHFTLLFCLAQGELQTHAQKFSDHLASYRDSCLILRSEESHLIDQSLTNTAEDQVVTYDPGSGWPHPNSLLMFLEFLMVVVKPATILLFGADGFIGDEKHMLDSYINGRRLQIDKRASNIMQDTIYFNALIYNRINKWLTRKGQRFPLIWNISDSSVLAGIPKIAPRILYEDFDAATSHSIWYARYQEELAAREALCADECDNLTLEQCVAYGLLDLATSKALQVLKKEGTLTILAFRVLLLSEYGTRHALELIHSQALNHLKWAAEQLEPWLEQYQKYRPWLFASDSQ